jgi:hypothetical protein
MAWRAGGAGMMSNDPAGNESRLRRGRAKMPIAFTNHPPHPRHDLDRKVY